MSPLTNVVFDRDGTIFDSSKIIYSTLRRVILKHGKECPSLGELQTMKASTDEEYWSNLLGKKTMKWRDYEAELRRLMRTNIIRAKIFPQVVSTLKELKLMNLTIALISALPGTEQTKEVLLREGLFHFFGVVLTADDIKHKIEIYTAEHYPRKLILIREALKLLKANASESVVIGDTPTDIRAGKFYGAKTVGTLTGEGNPQELAKSNPDHIIDDLSELPSVIREYV